MTLNDLTIPDSYCNPSIDSGGHQCPPKFDCLDLSPLDRNITGFIGFGEFVSSVFTGILKCVLDKYDKKYQGFCFSVKL